MLSNDAAHIVLGILLTQAACLGERQPGGDVAVERVMRRGLVGDGGGLEPALPQARQHLGGVADERNAERAARLRRLTREPDRVFGVVRDDVAIAEFLAPLRAPRVDLDHDADAAGHLHGQRLRTAHAAEAGGQNDRTGEITGGQAFSARGECLVGALQDALRADIGPGAGGILAIHHQAFGFEHAVMIPGRPFADEIGVGGEHARARRRGAEYGDRLAGLDHQRLVVGEVLQRGDDGVEAFPVARHLSRSAVNDQLLRPLAVRERVLQHAQQALLPPAAAAQFWAAPDLERRKIGPAHRVH